LRWGRPITFDWYYSLDNGPVLSMTLDEVNSDRDPENPSYWQRYISERKGNTVGLLDPTAVASDQLSEAEEQILDEVFERFGSLDRFALVDFTHTLLEWSNPRGSRRLITVRSILEAAGMNKTDVEEIEAALRAEGAIDGLRG
jgi:hypothetical protein